MSCTRLDLTIEGALADPVIAAAMLADRVDPRRFEDLLRSTARQLTDRRPPKPVPYALAERVRDAVTGCKPLW